MYTVVSNNIYVTPVTDVTLRDYIQARATYCELQHCKKPCICKPMIQAALIIIEKGIHSVSSLYRTIFPDQVYQSQHAKRKLLQMPLVIIRCGSSHSGKCELFVMEHIAGIDYVQIAKFLESTKQQASTSILLNKPEFTQLLGVAQTERERQCISYCIYKSLGLSFKSARRHFGFNRMAQRIARMDKCINEIQTIHECADRIIVIKEASRLRSLGCTENSDSAGDGGHGGSNEVMDASTGNSDNTTDGQHGGSNGVMDASTGNSDNTTDGQHGGSNGVMDAPLLRSLCCTENSDSAGDGGHSGSNEVMDASIGNSDNTTDGQHGGSNGVMDAPLLRSLCCTENSDSAGDGGHSGSNEVMDASTGNSDNTTDGQHGGSNGVMDAPLLRSLGCTGNSDSAGDGGHGGGNEVMDAPLLKSLGDGYSTSDGHHTDDGHSQGDKAKALVIKRHANYIKRKYARHTSYRKKRTYTSKIMADCKGIGKVIEEYVQSRNVGADAWRRTGVLTFDGNRKVKEKATYTGIQSHLENVFKRKIGFGTVVQLCVARNKRRLSSKRYQGAAKVTSRRARKGFQLKYNPDTHWSAALYRGLSHVQYADGSNIVNINRDDAAGCRLDTMTTHKLHKTPMVQGQNTLTTYTDYVNKYPSTLQTTSYNFTGTHTTPELCAGVVKATGIYPKNPAQHSADIKMLESVSELSQAFLNPRTSSPKEIECIRVDGATDEGPSHEEVQFWWTERHFKRPTIATIISARNSGSSHLNRVELQNGCLSLGHANLFIPSTIGGSCTDLNSTSENIDAIKLAHNMDLATNVYISRVNGSPCGETTIQLYKGADSSKEQERRTHLLVYLKGSRHQKHLLSISHPSYYEEFKTICELQSRHKIKDLPNQYLFAVVCCLKQDCIHPMCRSGAYQLPIWYNGGPSIRYLPLPIPDPERPYGGNCSECKNGECYGHFMKPDRAINATVAPMCKPPSAILKEIFDKYSGNPFHGNIIQEAAKQVLLPPCEVEMWFKHLVTVAEMRKKGSKKAAETRQKNKKAAAEIHKGTNEAETFCGACKCAYRQYTTVIEDWICCDKCGSWFHYRCVGIEFVPERFFCGFCK